MSLTPMTIGIPLQRALSLQNIRINVPSTFTVGVSTSQVMQNAAERLLNLDRSDIEEMAKEIIFGQLRLTVASLTIEQINQDRESFLDSIRKNVSPELNKIGLYLINVNITDITDESDYIESIGKKAAAEAINQARIDVAEQDRHGSIGHAQATMEKEIKVAENVAASDKGKKHGKPGGASSSSSRKRWPPSARRMPSGKKKSSWPRTKRPPTRARNRRSPTGACTSASAKPRPLPVRTRPRPTSPPPKPSWRCARPRPASAVNWPAWRLRWKSTRRSTWPRAGTSGGRGSGPAGDREAEDRDRRRGRRRAAAAAWPRARPTRSCSSTRPRRRDSGRCWSQGRRLPQVVGRLPGRRQICGYPTAHRKAARHRRQTGGGDQEPSRSTSSPSGTPARRPTAPSTTANFLSGLIKSPAPARNRRDGRVELPKYLGEMIEEKKAKPAAE